VAARDGSAGAVAECAPMNQRRACSLTGAARWGGGVALAFVLAVAIAGCATQPGNPDVVFEDTGASQSATRVHATVEINYAQKGDTLAQATVTKYFGAQVLTTQQTRSGKQATLIRFDGGVPIWEIRADHTLTASIPGIGHANYALKDVHYGRLPSHFVQVLPDEGSPEPLERGGFYVFEISRASGARNWEAVKILADGSLEAYAAQPRAGSSYILCCGVPSDFTEPVVMPQDVTDIGDQDAGAGGSGN
jgi:hypothetical protein